MAKLKPGTIIKTPWGPAKVLLTDKYGVNFENKDGHKGFVSYSELKNWQSNKMASELIRIAKLLIE